LFVPGADARKIERAAESGADALILDLEDSVAPEKKAEARQRVAEAIRAKRFGDVEVAVRVNPPGTDHFAVDVEAVIAAGGRRIMLSKSESPGEIAGVARGLTARLWLLVETPLGIVNAVELARASESVDSLCFGPADFSLAMGLTTTEASRGIAYHARCNLVIAAKAAGVAAIDSVHLDVKNEAAFREDALLGLRIGYEGKLCIHPRQVAITNEVYTPSEAEIDHARRVLEAWEKAAAEGRGVFSLDGQMIDAPVVAAQARVLERARLAGR
jgi:citrate lyase subunit beta/citryl-CoA lyase